MDIIIGRDSDTSKLRLSVDKKIKLLGTEGSVPISVSRQHCSLTVNSDGTFRIKNLKSQNCTFVNGVQVESKIVKEEDVIELGADHYLLNWNFVTEMVPKIVDISYLQYVWEQYTKDTLALTVKERKANSLRSGTGLLTMIAIAVSFILGKEQAGTLYLLLYGLAISLSLAFFIKSMFDAGKIPKERQALTEKFQHDYTCPNCGRYLSQPYSQVKLFDRCPYCKTMFKSS